MDFQPNEQPVGTEPGAEAGFEPAPTAPVSADRKRTTSRRSEEHTSELQSH